jgi:hypothetical protein
MEPLEERRLLSVASAISASSPVNEGSYLTLTLSATLTGGDTLTGWSVDWGDGATASPGASTLTLAYHAFADGPNDFTIHTTATATFGATTHTDPQSLVMHVNNVEPYTTVTHGSSAEEGDLFSVVFATYSDPGADALTGWTIDWGDGGSDTYDGDPYSAGAQTMYHVFADGPATFGVTSTVQDEDGEYTNATWDVAVLDAGASFSISPPITKEGESFTMDIDYTDPGYDPVDHFSIDWGDGSAADTLPGDAWYAEHMYADGPTSHSITAIAYAEDANHTIISTVTVENVAPDWVIKAPPAHTPLNHSISIHWSDCTDAGGDSLTGWTIDWGDGNTNSVSDTANDVGHAYTTAGAYVVTLSAVDGDGTYSQQVNFNIDDSDASSTSTTSALSFDLQSGMLVANYDDDDGDHVIDYTETDPLTQDDDESLQDEFIYPFDLHECR